MNFLTNKYISPDELKNIAYNTSPKDIVSFCQVNTTTKRICRSAKFWHTYISDDQNKYNKLILSIAKNGDSKLFFQLWGNGDLKPQNIISEPYLLGQCYKIAYLNGHDDLATIFYVLNTSIFPRAYLINDNFDIFIKSVYDWWDNTILNKKNRLSEQQKQNLEHNKFDIIIGEVLLNGKYNYAIKLIKEWSKSVTYKYYLAHANSIDTFRKFAIKLKKMGYKIDYNVIEEIVMICITVSNFTLAEQLINEYGINNEHVYKHAISSSSEEAFDFVIKHIPTNKIIKYRQDINNKEICYYMIEQLDNAKKNVVILNSSGAFKPYEYVNIVMEYMGCISVMERYNIVLDLVQKGKYYMAKVFMNEVMVCST